MSKSSQKRCRTDNPDDILEIDKLGRHVVYHTDENNVHHVLFASNGVIKLSTCTVGHENFLTCKAKEVFEFQVIKFPDEFKTLIAYVAQYFNQPVAKRTEITGQIEYSLKGEPTKSQGYVKIVNQTCVEISSSSKYYQFSSLEQFDKFVSHLNVLIVTCMKTSVKTSQVLLIAIDEASSLSQVDLEKYFQEMSDYPKTFSQRLISWCDQINDDEINFEIRMFITLNTRFFVLCHFIASINQALELDSSS